MSQQDTEHRGRVARAQQLVLEAIPHLRERTVALVSPSVEPGELFKLGSGVPVNLGDATWILTAAHVIDDVVTRPVVYLSLPERAAKFRPDILDIRKHPDPCVDIAAFRISESTRQVMLSVGIVPIHLPRSVAFAATHTLEAGRFDESHGLMMLGGYPGDLSTVSGKEVRFSFFACNAALAGTGRTSPFPVRGIAPESGHIAMAMSSDDSSKIGDWTAAPTMTPRYSGISGGGLWWVSRSEKLQARLVGIYQGRYDGDFGAETFYLGWGLRTLAAIGLVT